MRLTLAILIVIAFSFPAMADSARVVGVRGGAVLLLEDGRQALLDGLRMPSPGDDASGKRADLAAVQALNALKALAVDRDVSLVLLADAPDRWGRWPADVRLVRDGTWLQGALLERGYARIDVCPLGEKGRLLALRASEETARKEKRGLWRHQVYEAAPAGPDLRIGRFLIVEGVPVADGGGRVRYLNFAENWREDFTLRAARRPARALERAGLGFKSLVGKRIRVRGWSFKNNGPMIEIECADQIEAMPQ